MKLSIQSSSSHVWDTAHKTQAGYFNHTDRSSVLCSGRNVAGVCDDSDRQPGTWEAMYLIGDTGCRAIELCLLRYLCVCLITTIKHAAVPCTSVLEYQRQLKRFVVYFFLFAWQYRIGRGGTSGLGSRTSHVSSTKLSLSDTSICSSTSAYVASLWHS